MTEQPADPQKRMLPPAYFVIALMVMVALHILLPGVRWLSWPWRAIGGPAILAGLGVALAENFWTTNPESGAGFSQADLARQPALA